MKKFTSIIAIITMFVVLLLSTSAHANLMKMSDWGFDLTGTGNNIISPIDEITLLSLTLNNSTPTSFGHGTFKTLSAMQAEHFQNDNIAITPSDLGSLYEITGVMRTEGYYNRNSTTNLNDLTFTSGTLNLYVANTLNYGTNNGFFGADDGILIASFELDYGSGTMNYDIPNPDGRTDLIWKSTYLKPGYWYSPNLQDMADTMELAITDSNNTIIRNPSSMAQSEFLEDGTMEYTLAGDTSNTQNFISSNGSFVPAAPVPEPATLLLFGSGLIFIGVISKKSKVFNN